MVLINPNFATQLIFIFGIINVISIILVFFSCRCLVGAKLVKRLWQYDWYKKFYKMHCYYWWLFIISVLLHTILAFYVFGIPF
jgi:hypothetical protein|tara:strand:- start:329 stop:577 length:249 start_codon:yes stop_codon:yes gene_type:complete